MEPPLLEEARDVTAEHLVRFSPCNPHSVQQQKVIVRNNTYGLNPLWMGVYFLEDMTFCLEILMKILFDSCTKPALLHSNTPVLNIRFFLSLQSCGAAFPLADHEAQPAPSASRRNPRTGQEAVSPGNRWCFPSQAPCRCSGSLSGWGVPAHVLSQRGDTQKRHDTFVLKELFCFLFKILSEVKGSPQRLPLSRERRPTTATTASWP